MRISYDKASRGLFIWFSESASHESEEVAPGIVVDYDRAGKPIGIEIEDVRGVIDEQAIARLVRPRIRRGGDLAKFRITLGLSQQQLADALEIPRNTLARWEREELAIEKPRMLELALSALLRHGAPDDPASRATLTMRNLKSTMTSTPHTEFRSTVSGRFIESGRTTRSGRRPANHAKKK